MTFLNNDIPGNQCPEISFWPTLHFCSHYEALLKT